MDSLHLQRLWSNVSRINRRGLGLAIVGLFAILIFLMRLHTYDEPFERDLTTYAVVAHELIEGRWLYSDLWDIKPPAIYGAYALSELIVGYGPQAIFLLNILASFTTLMALFYAGSHRKFGYLGGVFAAGLWVMIGGDVLLQANQPNTEAIINALVITAVALTVRAPQRWRVPSYLGIGLVFGIAGLFKQVCLVFALVTGIWHFIAVLAARKPFRQAALQMIAIGVGAALPWALTFLYFAITDRFEIFYATAIDYPRFYAGSMRNNIVKSLESRFLWGSFLNNLKPLMISGLILTGLGLLRAPVLWLLPLFLAISAYVAIALPGRFFPHYYQFYLPVLCLAIGWGMRQLLSLKYLRMPCLIALTAVLLYTVAREFRYFRYSPTEISEIKYGGVFTVVKNHGLELRRLVKPWDFIQDFGFETGIYFYSHTRPTAGVLWSNAVTDGPLSKAFTERFYRQVDQNPPKLVFIEDYFKGPPHELVRWLYERNERLGRKGPYEYYAPKDSSVSVAAKDFF